MARRKVRHPRHRQSVQRSIAPGRGTRFFRLRAKVLPFAHDLDTLYFNATKTAFQDCLNRFQTAVKGGYSLASVSKEEQTIQSIASGNYAICPELFDAYASNLRKAVNSVFTIDNGSGLSHRLRANVSRFAAYKAYHATQAVRSEMHDSGSATDAKAILRRFNSWQAAEYNTTVSRCRTAKQWQRFSQPDDARLFPNLRWLPSRSADPREEHRIFYNRVWPKNDPFWQHNQPGNLWNCKCDWEQTDDPATDGNPQGQPPHQGLEGNPAITGEVFTDNASYIKGASEETVRSAIRDIFRQQHKDDHTVFKTCIGNILFDKISAIEISKGAKTDNSYYMKQEVALNFDKYAPMLQYKGDEGIDLGHNKSSSPFFQRKRMFVKMKVYRLLTPDTEFQIKLGEFNDGRLNLYAITEP